MELKFDIETNRDNFKKIVTPDMGGVYFLYDKGMRLLYIGRAVNFRIRIDPYIAGCCAIETKETHKMFNTFHYIKLIFMDATEANTQEIAFIKHFLPPCNTIGTGRCRLPDRCRKKEPDVMKQVRIAKSTFNEITELINKSNNGQYGMGNSFTSFVRDAINYYLPFAQQNK